MGNPGVGSLRLVRAAIEEGRLEWEEYSHFGMITRLQAGAAGLPFLPMNQTGADDLESANPNIKRIPDPYGGKDVIVVPALDPGRGHRPRAAGRRERKRPSVGNHR